MMHTNEKAATAGNGHGSNAFGDGISDYPADQAATQRAVILAYLKRHGSISTLEARALLYIMHPAGRSAELRRMGHYIVTRRDKAHRCAVYVLREGDDHA